MTGATNAILAMRGIQKRFGDVNALDDVDFYNGVMRPVQVGLLRYYLDNGWPRDLLLSLTLEKLEISEAFYARVVAESIAVCAAGRGGLACSRIADTSRANVTRC